MSRRPLKALPRSVEGNPFGNEQGRLSRVPSPGGVCPDTVRICVSVYEHCPLIESESLRFSLQNQSKSTEGSL